MKTAYKFLALLVVLLVIVSCGATEAPPATEPPAPEPTQAEAEPTTAPEPEPTEVEEPEPEPEPAGLTCDEPIKIGLITDLTGGLAIYGTMIERSFMLGMEYVAGAPGAAGGRRGVWGCVDRTGERLDERALRARRLVLW